MNSDNFTGQCVIVNHPNKHFINLTALDELRVYAAFREQITSQNLGIMWKTASFLETWI
ncbi:MAG: hypothetical protein K5793_08245 [Nitrosarchaeum sp.]|nr:hypothetical protein [Nitrosarchaeum sp.]